MAVTQSSQPRLAGKRVVLGLACFALTMGAMLFFLLRAAAIKGMTARREASHANLEAIYVALETYANQPGGQAYPSEPSVLFHGLLSADATVNPAWPDVPGYIYVSGVERTGQNAAPADSILAYENVPDEKRKLGRLVLRRDGSIERLSEDAFKQRLTAQQARGSAHGAAFQIYTIETK